MNKEQQAIHELLVLIQSDRYPVGSALPSERNLAESLHTSRNTVRNAIRKLEARGMVCVRSGSGCYVTAKEDPFEQWLSVTAATGGEGLNFAFDVRKCTNKDDGDFFRLRIRLECIGNVVARHPCHHNIEEDQVWKFLFNSG